MSDRWYYAHDGDKIGPFSARQLMDLAVSGEILRTDTVWKEGVPKGVLAVKVQYLFPPTGGEVLARGNRLPPAATPASSRQPDLTPRSDDVPSSVPPEASRASSDVRPTAGDPPAVDIPEDIPLRPEAQAPGALNRIDAHRQTVRKLRAVALKGVTIVGQDGANVKYRKKCTECNHEDSSYTTMRITSGVMNAVFFCPKCRKKQDVKLQGHQG